MLNILSTIKITCIFLLLILVSFTSSSQTTEPAIAKVYYTLKHKRDTTNRDSVYMENMVLLVGKNASLFTSVDKAMQAKAVQKNIEQQTKNWTGPGLPRIKAFSGGRKISTQEIFQFEKEKKILIKEFLIRNYLYEEPIDEIVWSLQDEIKYFSQIKVQKATATFKGREWTAWFSPDIPFQNGPWKLHGLPGLILEAYDSKKEVQYLFTGFESVDLNKLDNQEINNNAFSQTDIKLPSKAIKVTQIEILKIKNAMYKDPSAFFKAQIMANGGFIDDEYEDVGLSFKKINNPIDLTENN